MHRVAEAALIAWLWNDKGKSLWTNLTNPGFIYSRFKFGIILLLKTALYGHSKSLNSTIVIGAFDSPMLGSFFVITGVFNRGLCVDL